MVTDPSSTAPGALNPAVHDRDDGVRNGCRSGSIDQEAASDAALSDSPAGPGLEQARRPIRALLSTRLLRKTVLSTCSSLSFLRRQVRLGACRRAIRTLRRRGRALKPAASPNRPPRARRQSASSRDRCSGSRTRPSFPRGPIGTIPSSALSARTLRRASLRPPLRELDERPNSASRVTRPVRTCPTSYVAGTVDHGSALSCFKPRVFCVSSSTRRTLTVISSPGATTCDVSDTRDHPISDTWSRPTAAPSRSRRRRTSCDVTRPVKTAATIDRRISAATARCSSSSSARCETTRFFAVVLYSRIRNV